MPLFKVRNMMNLVFGTFNASLFADSQVLTLCNSIFIIISLMSLLKLQYKVVSFAYISIFSILEIANVDTKKSNGPRVIP